LRDFIFLDVHLLFQAHMGIDFLKLPAKPVQGCGYAQVIQNGRPESRSGYQNMDGQMESTFNL
jgi:hypothetical protein